MTYSIIPPPIVESDLVGLELDLAVAKRLCLTTRMNARGELEVLVQERVGYGADRHMRFAPSSDWLSAGFVLERVRVCAQWVRDHYVVWEVGESVGDRHEGSAPTLILAAMRCVASGGPP